MGVSDTIANIAVMGGEDFTLCRDEKQAESMRVTAYNTRRKMPKVLVEDVGIQKYEEDGKYFIRIYKRGIADAEHWKRDELTGKLVPIVLETKPDETPDADKERMIKLMREEGQSDEQIAEYFKEE